jgi:hypothetical protein
MKIARAKMNSACSADADDAFDFEEEQLQADARARIERVRSRERRDRLHGDPNRGCLITNGLAPGVDVGRYLRTVGIAVSL